MVYLRKLMSNVFFLKYSTINYVQWKISPYEKYITITKQKWKYYDFARAINCTHKLTCVCLCMHVRSHTSQGTVWLIIKYNFCALKTSVLIVYYLISL